ncbi:MAG TPA: N-acetylmuramoyl-L-alanine amidase [Chthoniobacterales bacterium]|nr:N-acetylmuramoyl-L-alanine amidase [Chthoniobacterales bacterium]
MKIPVHARISTAVLTICLLLIYVLGERLSAQIDQDKDPGSGSEKAKSDPGQINSPPSMPSSTPGGPNAKSAFTLAAPFKIALDIGHTPKRGGVVSARGVSEYEFNRRLVNELWKRLQISRYAQSFVVNAEGNEISLAKRVEQAVQNGAQLFLAIHHDSVKDNYLKKWDVDGKTRKYCDDFHGYSIFISAKNSRPMESLAFANALAKSLLKGGFSPTLHHADQEHRVVVDPEKGIYLFDDLIVLKAAKMPAVLLECGVIVNREEEKNLNDQQYRNRLLEAISSGIESLASPVPTEPAKKQ